MPPKKKRKTLGECGINCFWCEDPVPLRLADPGDLFPAKVNAGGNGGRDVPGTPDTSVRLGFEIVGSRQEGMNTTAEEAILNRTKFGDGVCKILRQYKIDNNLL